MAEARRRRVALAVDDRGLTLGRPIGPVGYHGMWWRVPAVVTVPWADIDSVVLFSMKVDSTQGFSWSELCIGVRLRDGACLPEGEPKKGLWTRLNEWMSDDPLPADIALWRRTMGWRLDKDALADTVAAYAPDVQVVERIGYHSHLVRGCPVC